MKAILTKKLEEKGIGAIVESAGIAEKEPTPASDNARAMMKELGLSLEDHVSKHVSTIDTAPFDHILVVDQKTKDALIALGTPAGKIIILNEGNNGVVNPYGGDIEVYRACAKAIGEHLDAFVESIAR